MYIYDALINALSTHMIHINLNMIFYTHVEHSPKLWVLLVCGVGLFSEFSMMQVTSSEFKVC